jgi:hypothetical protein
MFEFAVPILHFSEFLHEIYFVLLVFCFPVATDVFVQDFKVTISKYYDIVTSLIRRILGLDDWIYWHLIHTTRNYRQL